MILTHIHVSVPSGDSDRGLGEVQSRVLRDLDGLLHGSQQALAPLPSQGGAETLGASDQQLYHHVGIFFHTFTWCEKQKSAGEKEIS